MEERRKKKWERRGKARGKVGYHLGSPRWEKIIRPRDTGARKCEKSEEKIITGEKEELGGYIHFRFLC